MLLVVSPNLAVDRVLEVDGFRSSVVQRSRSVLSQPGGKGSNVSRVFRQLGGEVVLVGFVGRRHAGSIVEPLRSLGVQVDVVEAYDGESRICTTICDPRSQDHPTVINEESGIVDPVSINDFYSKVNRWLDQASAILVTGSLCRGLPLDFYRRILGLAVSCGVFTAIDATGEVLSTGLQASPRMMKSNLEEASVAMGHLGSTVDEIAASLIQRNHELPQFTLVTLGEAGAVLKSDDRVWHSTPPRVFRVNPIGAGDAFAAGYIRAHLEGSSPERALRFATAVAASDASTIQPGIIRPDEITELVEATLVQQW